MFAVAHVAVASRYLLQETIVKQAQFFFHLYSNVNIILLIFYILITQVSAKKNQHRLYLPKRFRGRCFLVDAWSFVCMSCFFASCRSMMFSHLFEYSCLEWSGFCFHGHEIWFSSLFTSGIALRTTGIASHQMSVPLPRRTSNRTGILSEKIPGRSC